MRSDDELTFGDDFVPRGLHNLDGQLRAGASHSGNERNHFFINLGAGRFEDASAISGLDSAADGRVFTLLDYDRDGFQDVAVVNANPPLLDLYESQLGQLGGGHSVGLRFVGSSTPRDTDERRSNRDGIGARVEWQLGGRTIVRENTRGTGFATQNSPTLLVGLGQAAMLPTGRIVWPSGRSAEIPPIRAGQLVTLYEDPADSPDGSIAVVSEYRVDAASSRTAKNDAPALHVLADLEGPAPFRLLTSMATWCVACRRELPALHALRARFDPEALAFYGVPIDPKETREDLVEWRDDLAPPYEFLVDLAESDRGHFDAAVREVVDRDALPAALITDASGRVLHGQLGIPSFSTLRRLGVVPRAATSPAGP